MAANSRFPKAKPFSNPNQRKRPSSALEMRAQKNRYLSVFAAAIPFLKLGIEFCEFFLRQLCPPLLRHELLELGERCLVASGVGLLRGSCLLGVPIVEPVLRGLEPCPTGHDHGNARFFPFGVARRLGEFIDFREEGIDEFRRPSHSGPNSRAN